jgi:uncharacterized protein YndB with AHSA1/START domain
MSKRLLLVIALSFMPLAAAADDTQAPVATDTPAATDSGPSASPINPANALGPSTGAGALGPAASGNAGGSTNDSSALQPAGNNPIQSTNGDSTGLTAPNGQTLQGAAPSDQSLNVIKGEADGAPHSPDSGPNYWLFATLAVAFSIIVAAIIWLLRRRRGAPTRPASARATPVPVAAAKAEPTSSQRLRITIDRPVKEVFDFALDPSNTPKWISFIQAEETNEWPPQNGTIYKNQGQDGKWSEYRLSDLNPPHAFVLNKLDSTYHVSYALRELEAGSTELEYYEWMDEGNLTDPFTTIELHELKKVLEAKPGIEDPADPKDSAIPEDTSDEFTESDETTAEATTPVSEATKPAHDQPHRTGKKRRRHR